MTHEPTLADQAEEHGHSQLSELAIGVVIGRSSEFFDFFVYAIASVLVFPRVFFTFTPYLEATLISFAVFALTGTRVRELPLVKTVKV